MSRSEAITKWWNQGRNRVLLFQVLLILGTVLFFFLIGANALSNLEKQGITSGFSFLSQKAGFGIIQTLISYDESSTYGRTFLVGLLNTILISVLGIICATVLGFLVGIARLSTNWLIAKLAAIYIEIFRNLPLLLQVFFWYFAVLRSLPLPRNSLQMGDWFFLNIRGIYIPRPVPEQGFVLLGIIFLLSIAGVCALKIWARKHQEKTGIELPTLRTSLAIVIIPSTITWFATGGPLHWELSSLQGFNFKGGLTVIPELAALLLALTVYTSSLIAEIVRSGILSVNHAQTEAARALGLPQRKILRLVIIPQALRVMIPQMTSQYLNLVKNSSLATAIGYPDLVSVFAGTSLNQTGQAIEIIAMTMAVYLTINLTISWLMNRYNARTLLQEQ
ncbi:amino acid ABC transporter permease [Desulfobulbus sp. US1]|nr:amino acid ABC transporter permease [Desulfobulbus sp. US4]MCW5208846.1 amino acid ABC transporter permease [Desulfobulbus sp. US1]MCW5210575.1 amino acid ABC transporter permease [Desulfobulbus sp. N3]